MTAHQWSPREHNTQQPLYCIFIQYVDDCEPCDINEGCDSSWNGAIIVTVVGVFCVVIIIMVITNIMVWIYCFRKRHHTGTYIYNY